MGIYGYCVVPAGHAPPADLRGIGAGLVSIRAVDDLAAWVSEHERPEPTVEHVREHNQVVEAAVNEEVTPVPLRFGQWAAGFNVFEQTIAGKATWYRERLALFAGALEFGLRIIRPGSRPPARLVQTAEAVSGLQYMKALRDRAAAAQAEREGAGRVRAVITEVLGDLVRSETSEEGRTEHAVLNLAHLVSRDQFDEYRARAAGLRSRFPDLRFLISGPWVPYSFAA